MGLSLVERNRKLWEAVKKGDIAVSDLISDGGYLQREEENRFMRKVYATTPFLTAIRRVEMNSPVRRINKIGITGNFLNVAPASGTALDASKRSKVFTEYVDLTTTELIGSMYIPYDVIEDNLERGRLEDTIMDDILPSKIGRDMEKVILQGDTGSSDNLLVAFNGVLKQLETGSNLQAFTALTGYIDDDPWGDILEALPYEYREREDALQYFVHQSVSDAYMRYRKNRATTLGDRTLLQDHMDTLTYRGIPIQKTYRMPTTKALFTMPQNIILGVQRGIQFETARDIEARVIIIVVTMRIGVAIEEKAACVLATGLNPAGTSTTSSTTSTTT